MANDFQMFLQQEFVGRAIALMCVFGVMLVAVMTLLIYVRRRKRAARPAAAPPAVPGFSMAGADPMDMPDLHLLVEAPPQAPIVVPVAIPVSAPAAPPPPVRAARKGTALIPVLDGDASEAVEVMTILRDVLDGHLIVQMGDKAYTNINSDSDFKDRFTRVMRELATAAAKPGNPPPAARPAQSAAPPPPEPEAAEPEPPSLGSLIQQPAPAAPVVPPPPSSARMPGDLPSFRLEDNPLPKLKRFQKNESQPVPEVNLASAIESYLQYRLQQTGVLPGRSIHIFPAPGGGVSITVDNRTYEAVGDIAEVEVRELLAQIIQEWQERH
jgi:hypothetical protein